MFYTFSLDVDLKVLSHNKHMAIFVYLFLCCRCNNVKLNPSKGILEPFPGSASSFLFCPKQVSKSEFYLDSAPLRQTAAQMTVFVGSSTKHWGWVLLPNNGGFVSIKTWQVLNRSVYSNSWNSSRTMQTLSALLTGHCSCKILLRIINMWQNSFLFHKKEWWTIAHGPMPLISKRDSFLLCIFEHTQ